MSGRCSPTCLQTEKLAALGSLFSDRPAHDGLNLHGVVAIMEKIIPQAPSEE